MTVTGNYFNKYKSKNLFVKFLMRRFVRTYLHLVAFTSGTKWLDAGCGEGYLLEYLQRKFPQFTISGIDIGDREIALAKKLLPQATITKANVTAIPYPNDSFDVVAANEVLEHMKHPVKLIKELKRVSAKYVLISVPNEPFFRMVNVFRMKYLLRLGNTPGHFQNFTKKSLKRLLEKQFREVYVKSALLWNFALCVKK